MFRSLGIREIAYAEFDALFSGGGGDIDLSQGVSSPYGNFRPLGWMPNPAAEHGVDIRHLFGWDQDSIAYFRWYDALLRQRAFEALQRDLKAWRHYLASLPKPPRILVAATGEIQLDLDTGPTHIKGRNAQLYVPPDQEFKEYVHRYGVTFEHYEGKDGGWTEVVADVQAGPETPTPLSPTSTAPTSTPDWLEQFAGPYPLTPAPTPSPTSTTTPLTSTTTPPTRVDVPPTTESILYRDLRRSGYSADAIDRLNKHYEDKFPLSGGNLRELLLNRAAVFATAAAGQFSQGNINSLPNGAVGLLDYAGASIAGGSWKETRQNLEKGILIGGLLGAAIGALRGVGVVGAGAKAFGDAEGTLPPQIDSALSTESSGSSLPRTTDASLARSGGAAALDDRMVFSVDPSQVKRHYTTESHLNAILETGKLNPSLTFRNARHGQGQYFSDVIPGWESPVSLSEILVRNAKDGARFSHYLEIDTRGLTIIEVEGRDGVFLVPGQTPLNIADRITSFGENN